MAFLPQIQALAPNCTNVITKDASYYFSHKTCIGFKAIGAEHGYYDSTFFSRTTSKLQNELKRAGFVPVSGEEFLKIAGG